ncbi:Uncharacterized protein GBIM_11652 [Gryllus bimaculatus]|nr:Uncharacterized protein GBIM_11652 [Gryllus bimaculatus]
MDARRPRARGLLPLLQMRVLGRRLASCWGSAVARAAAKKLPSRRQLLRSAAWLLLALLVLSAPSFLYHQYVQSVEMYFYQLQMERVKSLTAAAPPSAAANGCTIPLYDPFDARVRRFMTLWPPVRCGQPQPYLTYVDGDGYIRVNHSGVRHAGLGEAGVQCAYAEIRRDDFTDDSAASRVPRFGQLGSSLFRGVPARSCPQAGVASEYCVCVREVALRAGDEAVQAAARALVAHVNALLRRAPPEAGAGPCAQLALARTWKLKLYWNLFILLGSTMF